MRATTTTVIAFLAASAALCQTPQFSAATLKPNKSGERAMNNHFGPGLMSYTNTPLEQLILWGWRLSSYQISGLPAWARSDPWDVEAKTDERTTMLQKLPMLQAFLIERFHLSFHNETRQLPQYVLEVAKGGPRLQEAKDSDPRRAGVRNAPTSIEGHSTTMAMLAVFLSGNLNLPVKDQTGLTGNYDFKVEWAADDASPSEAGAASVFTAVHELGLNLRAIKGPVEVMVIDHVEKPSAE